MNNPFKSLISLTLCCLSMSLFAKSDQNNQVTCAEFKSIKNIDRIDKAMAEFGDPINMKMYDVEQYTFKFKEIYVIDITISDGKISSVLAPTVCQEPVKPEHQDFCVINKELDYMLGKPATLAQLQELLGTPTNTVKTKGAKYFWKKDNVTFFMTEEDGVMSPIECVTVEKQQQEEQPATQPQK